MVEALVRPPVRRRAQVKSASPELVAHLNATTQFRIADLLTIAAPGVSAIRLTSADIDITAVSRVDNASHVFSSSGPRFRRSRTKLAPGLEVSSLTLTIFPSRTNDTIGGVPWPQAVRSGGLDEAQIILERAFMPSWGDTSLGTLILFSGRVGQADSLRDEIVIDVKSDLELLNTVLMPRNVYQPGCQFTLFDSGCGLTKSEWEHGGTVLAGSSASVILGDLGTLPAGVATPRTYTPNDGGTGPTTLLFTDYFQLGTIRFTSGVNAGLSRMVSVWSSAAPQRIQLARPFPSAPAAGDAFVITPGCDKRTSLSVPHAKAGDIRYGTCAAKFNNIARPPIYGQTGSNPDFTPILVRLPDTTVIPKARAFPYVPTPENVL
jgi:hypothetical protein